jgi:nucleotide-binding universal stress UspA family protein
LHRNRPQRGGTATDLNSRRIVVGFDGSEHSYRALDWALNEARLRGAPVLVVHAFDYRLAGTDPIVAELLAKEAKTLLDRALSRARDKGVDAEGRLECAPPARALVGASEGADLLVVGSRGRGGLVGALLGSVSTACVHDATCPILVIPPPNRVEQGQTDNLEAKDVEPSVG